MSNGKKEIVIRSMQHLVNVARGLPLPQGSAPERGEHPHWQNSLRASIRGVGRCAGVWLDYGSFYDPKNASATAHRNNLITSLQNWSGLKITAGVVKMPEIVLSNTGDKLFDSNVKKARPYARLSIAGRGSFTPGKQSSFLRAFLEWLIAKGDFALLVIHRSSNQAFMDAHAISLNCSAAKSSWAGGAPQSWNIMTAFVHESWHVVAKVDDRHHPVRRSDLDAGNFLAFEVQQSDIEPLAFVNIVRLDLTRACVRITYSAPPKMVSHQLVNRKRVIKKVSGNTLTIVGGWEALENLMRFGSDGKPSIFVRMCPGYEAPDWAITSPISGVLIMGDKPPVGPRTLKPEERFLFYVGLLRAYRKLYMDATGTKFLGPFRSGRIIVQELSNHRVRTVMQTGVGRFTVIPEAHIRTLPHDVGVMPRQRK